MACNVIWTPSTSTSTSTFMRLTNQVLHSSLNKFVIVYFDDILIFSRFLEHNVHLHQLFEVLANNELYINLKKCIFCVEETGFLGFIIKENHILMDEKKVETIRNWPIPTSIKEVQAFIGLASFYRKFIHNFSPIAAPITDSLRKRRFPMGQ